MSARTKRRRKARDKPNADVPQEADPVEAVQWKDDYETWEAVRALHADSELVAFRNEDGTVSIETPYGRMAAKARKPACRTIDWTQSSGRSAIPQPLIGSRVEAPARWLTTQGAE